MLDMALKGTPRSSQSKTDDIGIATLVGDYVDKGPLGWELVSEFAGKGMACYRHDPDSKTSLCLRGSVRDEVTRSKS